MKWAVVALVSLVAAGGGYLAGQTTAADERDASQAYKQAERQALAASYQSAAVEAKKEGKTAGREQGLKQGASAGRAAGRKAAAKQAEAARNATPNCPPGTTFVPRAVGEYMYPDGCAYDENLKYYEPGVPTGDAYGDQIPGTPGIQGE